MVSGRARRAWRAGPAVGLALATSGLAAATALATPSATAAPATASSATLTTSATSVQAREPLVLSGRLTPAVSRPVKVQRQYGTRWRPVAGTRSDARGRYSLPLRTDILVGAARYRVVAPATRTLEAATSPARTLSVASTGRAAQHSLLLTTKSGDPFRWDPCTTVRVRVTSSDLPGGAVAEVKTALRRVNLQSGLRLRYVGRTDFVPEQGDATFPSDLDLVVSFVKPGEHPLFPAEGAAAGYGGAWGSYTTSPNGTSTPRITHGYAMFNAEMWPQIAAGYGRGPEVGYQGTRGQLLLHELGHAVGMGHAPAEAPQLLRPMMTRMFATWGNGDAASLRKLGLEQGCVPDAAGPPTGRRLVHGHTP